MLVISCKGKLLITLIETIDMRLNANIILCNFLVDIMTTHSIIIELIVESEIFLGSNFFIKTN